MGNIIGEGFAQYVTDQIKTRQEKLGQYNNRSEDILKWYTNKTSWVKLASSVDIEGSQEPAKTNILFGGTSAFYFASGNNLRTGFIEKEAEGSNLSTYQYDANFGYRPMASITDVSVDYLNRGSLRKAEIKIKAFSIDQLEIISKLYMSVGFTVLLEWGHTAYLDNNGNLQQFDTFLTEPFRRLLTYNSTQYDIFNAINEERKKYYGNYDALYGKVTKFNWTFNEDGTYSITVNLISIGDIIESLKINFATTEEEAKDTEKNTEETTDPKNAESFLIASKDISVFHRFLYEASKNTGKLRGGTITTLDDGEPNEYKSITYNGNISKKYNMNPFIVKIRDFKDEGGFFGDLGKGENTQYYITLGSLLNYMQNNSNIFVKTNTNINPYVTYDSGSENNYCLTFYTQYSGSTYTQIPSDPSKCIIPFVNSKDGIEYVKDNQNLWKIPNNPFVGKVMNIELSLSMIAEKLISLKDKEGGVPLLDFLNSILNEVNLNLGSINQLEIFYDADLNIIKIVENAPLRYGNLKTNKNYAKFQIYGVPQDLGSFIKTFNFDVTISNEMATMITVGDQSNGNVIGENATGFSNLYNYLQLKDRISPVKTITPPLPDTPDSGSKPESLKSKLDNLTNKMDKGIKGIWKGDRVLNGENIETVSSNNTDYANLIIGELASNLNLIPTPMFLPFELKMSMEGLGGMKIYEKFTLTPQSDRILPDLYRDNSGNPKMDFLIKNLSHKINNNKWVTEVTALTVPAEPNTPLPMASPSSPKTTPTVQTIPTTYESVSCQQEATVRISPNYNLAQLSCAAPAAKYSLPAPGKIKTGTKSGNITREQIITNLTNLATDVIEIIKARYPTVLVTNAYRNKGGNSQHEVGEAVDLQFTDISGTISNQNALMLTRAQGIKTLLDNANGYDQFLLEYKTDRGGRPWIHISYKKVGNRRDVRTFLNDRTAPNGAGQLYNPLA